MKIKINTSVAGNFGSYMAGETVDAPAEVAQELISAGHATAAGKEPETATKAPAEKAVTPASRAKAKAKGGE